MGSPSLCKHTKGKQKRRGKRNKILKVSQAFGKCGETTQLVREQNTMLCISVRDNSPESLDVAAQDESPVAQDVVAQQTVPVLSL